jgi:hypothetical protein
MMAMATCRHAVDDGPAPSSPLGFEFGFFLFFSLGVVWNKARFVIYKKHLGAPTVIPRQDVILRNIFDGVLQVLDDYTMRNSVKHRRFNVLYSPIYL